MGWFCHGAVRCRIAFIFAIIVAIHVAPTAQAADFGDCCSDIETRIAEIEATTARKGNSKVSLQIYGQVNKALLSWDDGFDRDTYIVDNETSSTRLGFIGEAKMKPGWFAGYRMEVEFHDAASDEVFNGQNGDDGLSGTDLQIRQSYVYIESERYGRVSIGQQSPATDDITIINLGAQMSNAALHYNNNFGLRLGMLFGLTTDLSWGDFAHTVDTLRGDFVRWDSPAMYGFVLSAAAGENDVWDVGLRYQAEWNSVRFAAGIGYMDAEEFDFEDVRASASALHVPTGLFVSVAGGVREDHSEVIDSGDDANFYYAQLGIRRRLLPYGDTTFYGEYGAYNDFTVGRILKADIPGPGDFINWGKIDNTEVERWGVGVEQAFNASALLIYAQFHHYEAEIVGRPCNNPNNCSATLSDVKQALPVEPWDAVVFGARLQF